MGQHKKTVRARWGKSKIRRGMIKKRVPVAPTAPTVLRIGKQCTALTALTAPAKNDIRKQLK